jgi:2-polyprenyl-6-methoxyphenol hydroxylase-like FAD-dependent oxidoreductase
MGNPRVVIIGGGIGGLTAAVAMWQRNIEIEIYEQSAQIGEIGAGVALSPNAIKAYRALGLEAPIAAIGFESDHQLVRNWDNGNIISKVWVPPNVITNGRSMTVIRSSVGARDARRSSEMRRMLCFLTSDRAHAWRLRTGIRLRLWLHKCPAI